MFGGSRRHRAPAQPLTRETANPNAATAAASAFMRRESPSLSASAAAAALRARPTTPTNVAEVQSKRALRRSPSVGSVGSRDRTSRRDLQRSPSVSSMTERTFRSPSPARSPAPTQRDVPPVPSLPTHDQIGARTKSSSAHQQRKTTPLQTQPFQTASQKLKDGQQGSSWFGAANASDVSNVRKSDAILRSSVASPPPDDRASSPNPSINFSYPRGQMESPVRPRSTSGSEQALVYDPNSRRMVPRRDPMPRQDNVRVPDKHVPSKKKQDLSRSGSHLAKGTIARTHAPALETHHEQYVQSAPAPVASPEPAFESLPKSTAVQDYPSLAQRESTLVDPNATSEEPATLDLRRSDGATVFPHQEETIAQPPSVEPALPYEEPIPAEQPSEQIHAVDHATFPEAIDSVPLRSFPAGSEPQDTTVVRPDEAQEEGKSLVNENPRLPESQFGSVRGPRVPSESPARSAHFASTTDQLAIKHEPPPRSLSPRKSAMKHGSHARGASPSDDSSEASFAVRSLSPPEDSTSARKKTFRVSFDDQKTVVLGEAAPKPDTDDSPILPSPQTVKKPWHSIVGRYNKKDTGTLEDMETMTPRPALPLFGSIREKKTRDTEERPLVRPSERAWSPPPSSDALEPSAPIGSSETGLGQSSDVGVGSILASEQASRNAANISKYREPLPPVVTSLEGSGYVSNTDLSSEDEQEQEYQEFEDAAPHAVADVSNEDEPVPKPSGQHHNGAAVQNQDHVETREAELDSVPNISIIQPTPPTQLEEKRASEPHRNYFGIPGGFPDEDDSSDAPDTAMVQATGTRSDEPSVPVVMPTSELQELPANVPEVDPRGPEPSTPVRAVEPVPTISPTPLMKNIREEEEERTDESSIYSDAYEDLSDVEGDGFLSLDAVLTTPVKAKMSQKLFEQARLHAQDSSSQNPSNVEATAVTDKTRQPPIQTQDDWDKAKSYWRSLTTDKRRQLELEALEEAGEEADEEDEEKPKRITKRRSLNTSADIAAPSAAPAPTMPEQVRDPARVYQIQPGTKWNGGSASKASHYGTGTGKLRKSMRGPAPQLDHSPSPAQGGGMRKSLRGEPEAVATPATGMRKSLRANGSAGDSTEQRPTIKKANRPASYQSPPSAAVTEGHRRNQSAEPKRPSTAIAPSTVQPTLRRRGSDDSESSFTRTRASKGATFGFRSSMRGSMRETAPASRPAKGSGRFSLRSLSPTGSTNFRRESFTTPPPVPTSGLMRASMRSNSSDAGTSRKRFSGLSLSSGKKDKPRPQASRFAESSDEEGGPTAFSSRFADSSDEEEATRPQSKGKGMARTMRSNPSSSSAAAAAMGMTVARSRSESPDLPDSDDEIVQPKRPATSNGPVQQSTQGLQRSRSGRGTLVASPAPGTIGTQGVASRPTQHRRGSFMSILRRKKDPAGKISREVTESAARRDTKLERSTEQLNMMRSNSNPKLQKRAPSWPLPDERPVAEQTPEQAEVPQEAEVDDEKRPSTSAGPAAGPPARSFLRRRSTSYSVANTTAAPDEAGGTPKKKKFGTLRKMFKISD